MSDAQEQSRIYKTWKRFSNSLNESLDDYGPGDRARLLTALWIVSICNAVGAIGAILQKHDVIYFNVVVFGLIVAQGFMGACTLRHQKAVSVVLTVVSLGILALSIFLSCS